jgi:hypothetical protein
MNLINAMFFSGQPKILTYPPIGCILYIGCKVLAACL